MGIKAPNRAFSERAARALLEKHGCPVPYHEVRTRFLGHIATPELTASPLQIVEDLWGGELPAVDSIDDLNELLGALINGLWNELTRHQKRSQPFGCARRSSCDGLAQSARLFSS